MEHIDEKILELYVLESDGLREQRGKIEEHLKECAGCAALAQEMKDYYAEVSELRSQRTEASSEALTLRSMIVRVPPFEGQASPKHVPATVPARIVLFVIRHYAISSMSLAALIVGAFLMVSRIGKISDTNPSYARAKNEFLIVYNKDGEELWRKHIGSNFDVEQMDDRLIHADRILATVDVDKDGNNEIVAIYGWGKNRTDIKNSIVCYTSDGNIRWKYDLHRRVVFGGEEFFDNYRFYLMAVDDFDEDGKYDVVAVATHIPWSPNVIVRLDANNGTLVSEYWHSGMLPILDYLDINNDGKKELLFCGENNQFGRAALVVFDPAKIEGRAPARSEYYAGEPPSGSEMYYLLIPASDLLPYWSDVTNKVSEVNILGGNLLEVVVTETIQRRLGGGLHYRFNFKLECIGVNASDSYTAAHKTFEKDGLVKSTLDSAFFDSLRKRILYWDGEKFVEHLTPNKYYTEILRNTAHP